MLARFSVYEVLSWRFGGRPSGSWEIPMFQYSFSSGILLCEPQRNHLHSRLNEKLKWNYKLQIVYIRGLYMFKYHCDNKNYQKNEKGGNLSRFFSSQVAQLSLGFFSNFIDFTPTKAKNTSKKYKVSIYWKEFVLVYSFRQWKAMAKQIKDVNFLMHLRKVILPPTPRWRPSALYKRTHTSSWHIILHETERFCELFKSNKKF